MRAKTKMFHLECFRCAACRRHLGTIDICKNLVSYIISLMGWDLMGWIYLGGGEVLKKHLTDKNNLNMMTAFSKDIYL